MSFFCPFWTLNFSIYKIHFILKSAFFIYYSEVFCVLLVPKIRFKIDFFFTVGVEVGAEVYSLQSSYPYAPNNFLSISSTFLPLFIIFIFFFLLTSIIFSYILSPILHFLMIQSYRFSLMRNIKLYLLVSQKLLLLIWHIGN